MMPRAYRKARPLPRDSENPAAGNTAAADAGNTADGKSPSGTGASSDNNSSAGTSPAASSSSDGTEASLEGQEGGADAKVIESQTFSGVSLGGYENVQFTTREITENGRTRVEYSLVSDGAPYTPSRTPMITGCLPPK